MDPSFLIILLLAFGAMWLMTSRTRKQQREAADFRANLEVGQDVMTGSGLYGTIVEVDGDTITLESTPGNETRWIRAAIAKLVPPAEDVVADDEEEYDETDDEAYDDGTYEDELAADGTYDDGDAATLDDERDVPVTGDVRPDRGAGSHSARIDVPDDLSTLDDGRRDDGTSPR
ncbi:preprotein translocase subunit YajC [uncultured Cellulomonas sp.]|uniref:preprotein translocase subunit YajC n=1 Tax=uncultured Cellulomonas sp. TaxID=189682 RepID=UPI00260CD2AC|nr:preprotein translocase subunit YajC [uncultured Cellulomonas sp.]